MAWWLLTASTAATVTGCGTEQPAPPGTTSSSASSAVHVGSPPPAAPPPSARASDAVAPQCQTSDLTAGLAPETAAAGTVAFPIVFTNNGSGTCVLGGFPGVSYATGLDSAPVGAPPRGTIPRPARFSWRPVGGCRRWRMRSTCTTFRPSNGNRCRYPGCESTRPTTPYRSTSNAPRQHAVSRRRPPHN